MKVISQNLLFQNKELLLYFYKNNVNDLKHVLRYILSTNHDKGSMTLNMGKWIKALCHAPLLINFEDIENCLSTIISENIDSIEFSETMNEKTISYMSRIKQRMLSVDFLFKNQHLNKVVFFKKDGENVFVEVDNIFCDDFDKNSIHKKYYNKNNKSPVQLKYILVGFFKLCIRGINIKDIKIKNVLDEWNSVKAKREKYFNNKVTKKVNDALRLARKNPDAFYKKSQHIFDCEDTPDTWQLDYKSKDEASIIFKKALAIIHERKRSKAYLWLWSTHQFNKITSTVCHEDKKIYSFARELDFLFLSQGKIDYLKAVKSIFEKTVSKNKILDTFQKNENLTLISCSFFLKNSHAIVLLSKKTELAIDFLLPFIFTPNLSVYLEEICLLKKDNPNYKIWEQVSTKTYDDIKVCVNDISKHIFQEKKRLKINTI